MHKPGVPLGLGDILHRGQLLGHAGTSRHSLELMLTRGDSLAEPRPGKGWLQPQVGPASRYESS